MSGFFSHLPSYSTFTNTWMTYNRPEQFIHISARGCSSALIALSEDMFSTTFNTTVIEIGADNNEELIITDGLNGAIFARTNAPGLLECNRMKTFWVNWSDDKLAVGQGPIVSSGELLRYDGPLNGRFSAVALDAEAEDGAQWAVVHETGRFCYIGTQSTTVVRPICRKLLHCNDRR